MLISVWSTAWHRAQRHPRQWLAAIYAHRIDSNSMVAELQHVRADRSDTRAWRRQPQPPTELQSCHPWSSQACCWCRLVAVCLGWPSRVDAEQQLTARSVCRGKGLNRPHHDAEQRAPRRREDHRRVERGRQIHQSNSHDPRIRAAIVAFACWQCRMLALFPRVSREQRLNLGSDSSVQCVCRREP